MHQHSASKMKSTDTSKRDAVYEIDESPFAAFVLEDDSILSQV